MNRRAVATAATGTTTRNKMMRSARTHRHTAERSADRPHVAALSESPGVAPRGRPAGILEVLLPSGTAHRWAPTLESPSDLMDEPPAGLTSG